MSECYYAQSGHISAVIKFPDVKVDSADWVKLHGLEYKEEEVKNLLGLQKDGSHLYEVDGDVSISVSYDAPTEVYVEYDIVYDGAEYVPGEPMVRYDSNNEGYPGSPASLDNLLELDDLIRDLDSAITKALSHDKIRHNNREWDTSQCYLDDEDRIFERAAADYYLKGGDDGYDYDL